MEISWLVYGLGFSATLFFALTVYFHRRGRNLQEAIEAFSQRMAEGGRAFEELRTNLLSTQQKLTELQNKHAQLSHDLSQSRGELKDTLVQLEVARQRATQAKQLTLERDHLGEQVVVLTDQLREAQNSRKVLQNQQMAHLDSENRKLKQEVKRIAREVSEAQHQVKVERAGRDKLSKEIKILQDRGLKADKMAIHRLRQRIMRNEQIYTGMKSLKDLAEERNANLEVAARTLASYVLGETAEYTTSRPLGELVGDALERAGGTLVVDEFENVNPPETWKETQSEQQTSGGAAD